MEAPRPLEVNLLEDPPGPEGKPLKFVEDHPDFPPDGKPDPEKGQEGPQPRLLEVHGPTGFESSSDCSNLTCMDAIITILYNYNPALLQKAFNCEENMRVRLRRKTYKLEKYDVEIIRNDRTWVVSAGTRNL